MPQLRVRMPHLRSPPAATKTWGNQINFFLFIKKVELRGFVARIDLGYKESVLKAKATRIAIYKMETITEPQTGSGKGPGMLSVKSLMNI